MTYKMTKNDVARILENVDGNLSNIRRLVFEGNHIRSVHLIGVLEQYIHDIRHDFGFLGNESDIDDD